MFPRTSQYTRGSSLVSLGTLVNDMCPWHSGGPFTTAGIIVDPEMSNLEAEKPMEFKRDALL